MWSSLNTSFTKVLHDTVVGLKRPKGTNLIHRDDLGKNPSSKKVKNDDFLAKSPLICREENIKKKKNKNLEVEDGKSVIRVKVKMTKQEAARLMSKCKEGGVLEFRDVAHELVQIPINRVNVVSSGCGFGGGSLMTIHEEI